MPRREYEDEPKKEEETGIRVITPEEMLHLKLNSIIERLDFLINSLPKEEKK